MPWDPFSYILSHSKPFTNTNSNLAKLLDLKRTTSPSLQQWIIDNPNGPVIPQSTSRNMRQSYLSFTRQSFLKHKQMQEALQDWLDGKEQEDKARHISLKILIFSEP